MIFANVLSMEDWIASLSLTAITHGPKTALVEGAVPLAPAHAAQRFAC